MQVKFFIYILTHIQLAIQNPFQIKPTVQKYMPTSVAKEEEIKKVYEDTGYKLTHNNNT